jgi:hypothetical protein
VLAYRVRNGHDGIDQTAIARSADGEPLTRVVTLDETRFGAEWMERPALVQLREGGWPVTDVRYLGLPALPDGGCRIYYEPRLPDESHELRTERIPRS